MPDACRLRIIVIVRKNFQVVVKLVSGKSLMLRAIQRNASSAFARAQSRLACVRFF